MNKPANDQALSLKAAHVLDIRLREHQFDTAQIGETMRLNCFPSVILSTSLQLFVEAINIFGLNIYLYQRKNTKRATYATKHFLELFCLYQYIHACYTVLKGDSCVLLEFTQQTGMKSMHGNQIEINTPSKKMKTTVIQPINQNPNITAKTKDTFMQNLMQT